MWTWPLQKLAARKGGSSGKRTKAARPPRRLCHCPHHRPRHRQALRVTAEAARVEAVARVGAAIAVAMVTVKAVVVAMATVSRAVYLKIYIIQKRLGKE